MTKQTPLYPPERGEAYTAHRHTSATTRRPSFSLVGSVGRVVRCVLVMLFLCAVSSAAHAQDIQEIMETLPETDGSENEFALGMEFRSKKAYYHGDSIPFITYPPLYKYAPFEFKNAKEQAKMTRLINNVRRLLPLAKKARLTIIETYEYAQTLPNDKARAAHFNAVQKGLWKEYGPTFKKMSSSQGRLFIKLIDRECKQTSYHVVQAFLGSARANAFQSVGWIFNLNLNKKYDPEGDDRITERVCRLVESGQL